jgi:hypothetical protein
MSLRAAHWTLWVLLLCTAPVPYMLGGVETAPPVRLLMLTAITVAVQIAEGSGGYVWNTFIALGVVQFLLYAIGLYMCAALIARLFVRAAPSRRRTMVGALCAVVVAIAIAFPIYETPMSSRSLRSNLVHVLR